MCRCRDWLSMRVPGQQVERSIMQMQVIRDHVKFFQNASIFSESGWKRDHQWRMGMDKQVLEGFRREKVEK